MNTRQVSVVAVVIVAAVAGWLANELVGGSAGQGASGDSASPREAGPCAGGAEPLYWKAPMDPTYVRDAPGKSPMGMDLVPVCPDAAGASATAGIRIDPALMQSMGVRTAPVERQDLARTIRAVGRVAYDERRVAHVHTKIQGWVEKLHVDYEGQMVARGEPLLEIYSPELVATQEELLVAARYRDETAESPFADVRQSGARLFDATRRRLELWDIPDRDIDRLIETETIRKNLTLYSPAKGVVTHLMVREGMEVRSNQNLYTIADLSRVWVYADVYEYELPWVAVGQKGVVELSYLPGAEFEGEVTYVYPFLDPKTRTARVRIEIENAESVLKPDMFANVRIQAETRRDTLAIPDEAVLRSGRRNLVRVASSRAKSRWVSTPATAGSRFSRVCASPRRSSRRANS
jgi:multidrug efflux pump subunit AcrA (membrane-fusion protein)